MPKISIITVNYNEPNVGKTCESITAQTFDDFEWIVIDGGSNAQTLKVLDKYRKKMDVFISEPDKGVYNAMNKGLKHATGDYVLFLNAGDWFANNDVLNQVSKYLDGTDVVYGDYVQHTDLRDKVIKFPAKLPRLFFIYSYLPHPATFIKRDLFERYGYYNENYKICSDWERFLYFIYVKHATYKHMNLVVSVFNMDGISSKNDKIINDERDDVINKYYSKKDIDYIGYNNQYNFTEQIFSIKPSRNGKLLIITLFGIHIKLKKGGQP